MANQKTSISVSERNKFASLTMFAVAITMALAVGIVGTSNAQTKKTTAVQEKNTTINDTRNTPMPENNAMVLPADKATASANTTETQSESFMDRAIMNYVYSPKAKKTTSVDSTKKINPLTLKQAALFDKRSMALVSLQ